MLRGRAASQEDSRERAHNRRLSALVRPSRYILSPLPPKKRRTAEKTFHDDTSLYIHPDLRGFRPNDTTYVFFGRRGSGKTTIRLQMEEGYRRYNSEAAGAGRSRGHYVVDLSEPSHLTACLRNFQDAIGSTDDDWNAAFGARRRRRRRQHSRSWQAALCVSPVVVRC